MRIEFADLQRAEAEQIATLERQARREEAYGTPFATRIARSLRLHAEHLRQEQPGRFDSDDTPIDWFDPANRIELPGSPGTEGEVQGSYGKEHGGARCTLRND